MTKLTFYGGVNEIGGNKILLEDSGTKIFLDFGMSLNSTHVSGHASGPQLRDFVKTVKPKMVIPVHTLHANFYDKWWDKVHLLKKVGEKVEIK